MNLFRNKILLSVLFVVLVVIVPSFIFSIYQYSTITDEEMVIDEVYNNQLESILFSINQYSVDVTDAWINEINEIYSSADQVNLNSLEDLLYQNDVLKQFNIYSYDHPENPVVEISKLEEANEIGRTILDFINNNPQKINELIEFLESDYQKVLGEKSHLFQDLTYLVFALKMDTLQSIGVLTIDTKQFISETLSPKIQHIGEERMNILVFKNDNSEIIYSNSISVNTVESVQKSKELWLIPGHNVGIHLTGNTLNDLVRKRVRTVIFLVILFNLLIIFGTWFLYYNVKKEMELAKIKGDFVSNVSHELRTPLAMISMYSETLMMDRVKDDQKKKEYYEVIQLETNRLNGIVNNILNFSRIENNKRSYSFNSCSINEPVNEVIHVYKHELQNKGFTYDLILSEDLLKINIDKDAVKDAIINLISNSIKYSENNKHISIITNTEGKYQFIEIKDKGVGINEKEQKHIFEKFYRVREGDLAYKAQGSGLGLSIVKHIVDAHNGRIIANSKPNEGSSFKLLFPSIT